MIKPEKWYDLPYQIRESVVEQCELDYDAYESSQVEAVARTLDNPTYNERNDEIVQSYFDSMSEKTLFDLASAI